MQYWLEEYKIDGFRFDLSKGFAQVDNLNDVGHGGVLMLLELLFGKTTTTSSALLIVRPMLY